MLSNYKRKIKKLKLNTFKRSVKVTSLIRIHPNEGKVSLVLVVVILGTHQTIEDLRTRIVMAVARKVRLEVRAGINVKRIARLVS